MSRTKALLINTIVPLAIAAIGVAMPSAHAQQIRWSGSYRNELFVDTPAEIYLRYLQTTGEVPLYPWSSRGFSQRELKRLVPKTTSNPWHDRLADESREVAGFKYGVINPSAVFRYNTTFAYGSNDGPVWAGRGLTSATQLGFYVAWKPITLTVAPLAFRAGNQDFDILPTGRAGNAAYGDPVFGGIDRPQRFGNAAYSQIDPGQTTLRVDMPVISFGASSANQGWGPGQELPVILGDNAAGFPHLFVGTSEPLNIFIGTLHGKVIWGELTQSSYSPVTGPSTYLSRGEPGTRRFATGLVVVGQPRGLPGLEIGGTRFFHSIWPRSGIPASYFTKFLQGFIKKNLTPDRFADPRFPGGLDDRGVSDNQLLSVFARWVLPHSGFELHAEYGRDDHSYDLRDLTQEPDHSRVYSLGARKVFKSTPGVLTAGRFEIMNFQVPQLVRYRGEGEVYVHGLIRQGHTYRGQMLGADVGAGSGAGSVVAVDRFSPHGSWTASWSRVLRRENGNYINLGGVRSPRSMDVSHAVGFQTSRFMKGFDLDGGLTFVYDFNRDFKEDAVNLNALFGVRYLIR